MTLPIGSVDPNNLPQGVIKHDELGSALQDQSAAKFKSEAASRFPSMVNGTSAGNPANVGGPLGYVVNLSSKFTSKVANADPATIKKPDDLLPLANPFFNGLPLMNLLERIPIIGSIIKLLTGVATAGESELGNLWDSLVSAGWSGLLDMHTHLAEVDAAIANLEEVGAASSTTPAYVADIQDMATIPRSQLTTFAISGSVNSTLIGGHTHSISSGATSTDITRIGSHTHEHNFGVSVQLPVYTPDRLNFSSTSYVDFTPIVVDRAGVVKKLRWIVGADTAVFGIDAYYVALCIYNPSTGAVEKVWDSGDIKDGVANTTNLQEVELDMGIDQHCTPGQVLYFAHQQIAPGILQGTRSFAAVPQAGIARPSTLLLDACTYRSKTRLGSIPSSIARSGLTRINSRIPWAAVSVDTTEAA